MRSICNIDNIKDCSNPTYVLVRCVGEIKKIIEEYPTKDMIFKLLLTNLDEELLNLLESIPYKIEIIYKPLDLEDRYLKLLVEYQSKTNSKIYVSYNIDEKSSYDRANLLYYLNRYSLISLLETNDFKLYQEWLNEMTKYTSKNNVRKLNHRYIQT